MENTMNNIMKLVAVGLVVLGFTATAAAEKNMDKPVCQKWLTWGDKFGNSQDLKEGTALHQMCRTDCKSRGLTTCKPAVDALNGKTDPKQQEAIADMFYFWDVKNNTSQCIHKSCRIAHYELAPVVFALPNAKEVLTSMIDTNEKLSEISCGTKAKIARALWYLGDKSVLDTLIASYENTLCTAGHIKNTLPVIHLWGPSPEQHAKIESFCVDKIFPGPYQDNLRNAKDAIGGCYRYLAATGSQNDDGLEYIRQGAENSTTALRALAILDAKGSKKNFKKRLAKQKKVKTKTIRGKGKKKDKKIETETWRGREESITSALALGYKDKEAKKAINWWLSLGEDKDRLNDTNGWEYLFLTSGFFPTDKKLLKAMEKAYAAVVKASENEDRLELYALRAAIGLAQNGSAKGLPLIIDMIKGTDKGKRGEALQGLGGIDHYWGSFRSGTGGIKVGGKGGLKKADVEKLIKTILKKMKFMKDRNQEAAALAVLDMRARMRVAGL
jgi:hypothetical protein